MGEEINMYTVLMGKPVGRDHLEDQGIDWRMGSSWILERLNGFNLLRIAPGGRLL
jgi:hypothetical protein